MVENGAREVLLLMPDRIQHGLEELGPGRAAGVAVSVHPKTPQGDPALSAKRLGLGTVLQGAFHHAAAEVLAKDVEDLVGSSRFDRGLVGHGGCSLQERVFSPSTLGKDDAPTEGKGVGVPLLPFPPPDSAPFAFAYKIASAKRAGPPTGCHDAHKGGRGRRPRAQGRWW